MNSVRIYGDPGLPDGWQVVRLGEFAKVGAGNTPTYSNDDGTVPVFGSNGQIGLTDKSNFSNGVAVGRVGASGSVHRVAEPVWLSDNVLFVQPESDMWELSYLYNALQLARLPELASKTAQPLLTQTNLAGIKLRRPPLSEQRAIAGVLDSIDEAIERTEAVISATLTLRDSLLHELLTRGVPGWHTEWKDVPGIGTIPADWEVVRLGEMAEVVTGNTPSRDVVDYYGGEVPWAKPSDLAASRLVHSSEEYLTEAGLTVARQVPANSVLFSCIGTIGEVGLSTVPISFNQQINALVPRAIVLPTYLYWACVRTAGFIRSISAKTAVPIVNKTEFSAVRFSLPPLNEQRAITEVLDSVDEATQRILAERIALQSKKDSTAQALLSGNIRLGLTQPRSGS